MKELKLVIEPKVGFGELKFGDTSEKVIDYLGEADDIDNLEDDDGFNTVILSYWDKGISVFFEGKEKSVISCFETEDPYSTLFGEKVFKMTEKSIIALMDKHGYEVAETEMETSGEKRISYDDAMCDFFFHDGELVAVNWGVLINDKGEIEEF
jgi:hypothetical protein